ncbi:hypothetical protein I3843_13G049600, partial [Carya illinoinensis]
YLVCNWVGVTCGSKHHRVTALDLSNNGLVGTIPPHIGNLSFLVSLSLRNNSFHGSMPNELSHLYRLELLHFGYNELSGEIPSWIGLLTKLQSLLLPSNNFEGTTPSSLFKCTSSLQQLVLEDNQPWGSIPSSIFKSMSTLQLISLAINKFSGPIPSIVFNMSSLQYIDLSNNTLSGTLPSRELNHAYMCSPCQKQLRRFVVTGAIPSETGNLQNLEVFHLGINNFAGTIPLEIFNISTIQAFSIVGNHLLGTLPSDMGLFLPNLSEIYFGMNELSGTIPASICNASQLITVDLSRNSFSGLIPKTLGNLRLLQWLNLEFNNLTIESSELILYLSMNLLNGVLPNSIGNLSIFLERLQLDDCNIKGNIPIDIGNLSRLVGMSLGGNDLAGPIPTTIGRLRRLQGLYLFYNRLKGSIPSDICYLGRLGSLHLAGNKLSGQVLESINNMTSLRFLNLAFNKLISRIPLSLWRQLISRIHLSLWRQTDLLKVDLSSNFLSGSLSLDIGNMKVLKILNLSRNQLFVNLSLAVNQLKGSIPISFGGLVSLELLDLNGNNLSGEILKSLEVLRYLKYLNVSYNKLRGEIPTQGPFVNFSAESLMSNDALCGMIRLNVPPCKEASLGPRKAMRVLILKYVLPTLGLTILVVSIVPRRISHLQLLQAAEGFSANNLLGEGSFGSFYKRTLLDGTYVAIKVLNLEVEGAFKSFDIECEILRYICHRNLVKIISICSNIDFKALVLEYMPKGNLEVWLCSNTHCLNMLQRLNIMIDVATTLEYLHLGYSALIVHYDLKPNNILLDEDMVGHVTDFDIAKLLSDGISLTQTMTMATIGYMAPENGYGGIVSTRGDVYSYGILLLETFTRKNPVDDMFTGEMSLKRLVEESFSLSILEVIDANLLSNENDYAAMETCLSSTMVLALHYCVDLSEQRIDMKNVLARLNKIKLTYLHDHREGKQIECV